ncbi:AAA family ATPase [Desertifilum sp. FACHB-1129]|uniref:ATPase n=1 Tax=Desertifilum tharense IPPAS B-1220 TaxID=1781255 RepID=A0A1E5QN86_9CYAN|nr:MULTISPECIES: AAA family ATPase [Desertifilum]MDA0213077.1 AAA family ATPase [Cyanobacteria bacterium FC1]MBD2312357.1 AAA family ATPase [Desertifilum sp. FACHB-1129]MBD2321140.1 AAA family ATPase [Desertifilum sp. FACHB-866]MBD2331553.1 AAA family ATPase [Desertifilum sp. FACHB-868]OEJ76064.1 ATPase [Desertifilum tharense IPPAS B-1220]
MLQRLYVHNFRCLENFELSLKGMSSALLIGKNGVGKSTISSALELLQTIGRGQNRVGQLIQTKDFSPGRSDIPIRFEIEVLLEEKVYKYVLALELPESFRELRVREEQLLVAGASIFSRQEAQVTLSSRSREAQFLVDWHLIALPVIQEQSEADPLRIFRTWLARMVILSPIPSLMTGDSNGETLEPKRDGSNFGEWFSGLLSRYPAAYKEVDKYLQTAMPDISDIYNELIAKNSKSMIVRFEKNDASLSVDFKDLSDGEKCFFLCAVVLAANKYYGPLFCFWDEPDNHLSLSEVGHFMMSLRRSFKSSGQILATSHNEEAIRKFSSENTFLLDRKSHLEPTLIRLLSEVSIGGDIIDSLILGDAEL